jgi:hypothetical protein
MTSSARRQRRDPAKSASRSIASEPMTISSIATRWVIPQLHRADPSGRLIAVT